MGYYEKPENVLFFSPVVRLLVRIFGPEHFVMRCKTCNKIPTDMYGEYCEKHIKIKG